MFCCYYVSCMRWVLAAGWRLVKSLICWISHWRVVGAKIVFLSAWSAKLECKLLICCVIWGLPVSFPDPTALTLEEEQQLGYLLVLCVWDIWGHIITLTHSAHFWFFSQTRTVCYWLVESFAHNSILCCYSYLLLLYPIATHVRHCFVIVLNLGLFNSKASNPEKDWLSHSLVECYSCDCSIPVIAHWAFSKLCHLDATHILILFLLCWRNPLAVMWWLRPSLHFCCVSGSRGCVCAFILFGLYDWIVWL